MCRNVLGLSVAVRELCLKMETSSVPWFCIHFLFCRHTYVRVEVCWCWGMLHSLMLCLFPQVRDGNSILHSLMLCLFPLCRNAGPGIKERWNTSCVHWCVCVYCAGTLWVFTRAKNSMDRGWKQHLALPDVGLHKTWYWSQLRHTKGKKLILYKECVLMWKKCWFLIPPGDKVKGLFQLLCASVQSFCGQYFLITHIAGFCFLNLCYRIHRVEPKQQLSPVVRNSDVTLNTLILLILNTWQYSK